MHTCTCQRCGPLALVCMREACDIQEYGSRTHCGSSSVILLARKNLWSMAERLQTFARCNLEQLERNVAYEETCTLSMCHLNCNHWIDATHVLALHPPIVSLVANRSMRMSVFMKINITAQWEQFAWQVAARLIGRSVPLQAAKRRALCNFRSRIACCPGQK